MSAECPNGCDLEEFGGTHQGPPDCDLEPSNPDHPGQLITRLTAERDAALARLARIEALFSGGPDTVCRTTWRESFAEHVECVEVPMADLRDALGEP